jgi:hypothetical protein
VRASPCPRSPERAASRSSIFYYPWYGTPAHNGVWEHWDQNGHAPPLDVYSPYWPALGLYSSSQTGVLARQMREIAAAGVDEVAPTTGRRCAARPGRPASLRRHRPCRLRGRGPFRRDLHLRLPRVPGRRVRAALRGGARGPAALRPERRARVRCKSRGGNDSVSLTPQRGDLRRPLGVRARCASGPGHDHELQRMGRGHPDRAARGAAGYSSYDDAGGLRCAPAQDAYLSRTAYWARRFR